MFPQTPFAGMPHSPLSSFHSGNFGNPNPFAPDPMSPNSRPAFGYFHPIFSNFHPFMPPAMPAGPKHLNQSSSRLSSSGGSLPQPLPCSLAPPPPPRSQAGNQASSAFPPPPPPPDMGQQQMQLLAKPPRPPPPPPSMAACLMQHLSQGTMYCEPLAPPPPPPPPPPSQDRKGGSNSQQQQQQRQGGGLSSKRPPAINVGPQNQSSMFPWSGIAPMHPLNPLGFSHFSMGQQMMMPSGPLDLAAFQASMFQQQQDFYAGMQPRGMLPMPMQGGAPLGSMGGQHRVQPQPPLKQQVQRRTSQPNGPVRVPPTLHAAPLCARVFVPVCSCLCARVCVLLRARGARECECVCARVSVRSCVCMHACVCPVCVCVVLCVCDCECVVLCV